MTNFSINTPIAIASDDFIAFDKKDLERFIAKIDFSENCWTWTNKLDNGYGRFWLNNKLELSHRFAWLIWAGQIPANKQLDHLCRNRACVNPAHLEPVSIKENVLRGLGTSAQNARKIECSKGHQLTGYNLYLRKNGARACRTCSVNRTRQYRGQKNEK